MANKDKHIGNPPSDDSLDQIAGSITGSGNFIPESTMIPESGYVPHDEVENDDGPQVMPIEESVSTSDQELPVQGGNKSSILKKNLPMVIFGVVAAGLMGVVALKALGVVGGQTMKQTSPIVAADPVAQSIPIIPAIPAASIAPMASAPDLTSSEAVSPDPRTYAATPVDPVRPIGAAVLETQKVESNPTIAGVAPPGISVTSAGPLETSATSAAAPLVVASSAAISKIPTPVEVDDLFASKPVPAASTSRAHSKPPVAVAAVEPSSAIAPAPDKEIVKCEPSVKKPLTQKHATHKKQPVKAEKTADANRPKKVPSVAETLPSTDGYRVHMGANGLAWLTLPSGETLVLAKGDRIDGLGVVNEIDVRSHTVHVGRVTLR